MPEEPKPESNEKLGTAREVVLALDRAVRTRRMYPSDHLRAIEVTEELVLRFLRFFDNYTYLRLEVLADELRFDQQPLMKAEAHAGNLPFILYKDGLREIRFHRGISRDELLDFLNVVESDPRELDAANEDVVSLLWSRDFASIDFAAVDEFDMTESPTGIDPAIETEVKQVSKSIAGLASRITSAEPVKADLRDTHTANTRMFRGDFLVAGAGDTMDGASADGTGELPADPPSAQPSAIAGPAVEVSLDDVFDVEVEDARRKIREEIEVDTVGSAVTRTIDALENISSELSTREVERMVAGFAEYYVQKHDYCAIGHLLAKLQALGAKSAAVERAIEKLSLEVMSKELSGNLLEFLNRRFTDDHAGLERFLETLGPQCGPMLCRIYSRVASPRTRKGLRETIVKYAGGSPEALRELLLSSEKMLSEVLELLMEIRPVSLVKDLEEFARHPTLAVRLQAISLLGAIEGHERTKLLFRLLEDPDQRIRLHILATLAAAKDRGTVLFLKEWVGRKVFHTMDPLEKKAAFDAMAAISGNSVVPYFERIAMARPPRFRGQSIDDTRRAAVGALASMLTQRSKEALARILEKGDSRIRAHVRGIVGT